VGVGVGVGVFSLSYRVGNYWLGSNGIWEIGDSCEGYGELCWGGLLGAGGLRMGVGFDFCMGA